MVEVYIPWTTVRNILHQIDNGEFVPAVKWIKDSRGVDLRCAKEIADALRDGDFETEDYLDGRYVHLTVDIRRLTLT